MKRNNKYPKSRNKFKHPKEIENFQSRFMALSKPYIIGYMSVDEARQYHFNLSQLKYLTKIPTGRIHFNLNHNIDAPSKRTTDNNNEMINLLLQYLLDQRECLNLISKKIDFICYRRTLISIMCNAFDEVEPLLISACLYNGSIYLCTLDTLQEIMKRKSRTKEEEKFCAWGYKFEQYLLSDSPNTCPNIERPVIENEEFSLFYYASLGSYNLIYGAQIDGMLATNGAVPNPPANLNTESNLNYLRNNEYLELKTNRHLMNQRQERNFRRYKMLRCWCQCYLANLKGLLVGFRNEEGIVERLQWYEQQEIIKYCKNEWNPETALNYLNYFLSYIKNCLTQKTCTGPVTLNFQLNSDKTINVIENSIYEILPQWYTTN